MEPLTPAELEMVRRNNPDTPAEELDREVAEYQRLVVDSFTVDPDQLPPVQLFTAPSDTRTSRLGELHSKLFAAGSRRR